jgi:hypothetical protein
MTCLMLKKIFFVVETNEALFNYISEKVESNKDFIHNTMNLEMRFFFYFFI